MKRSRVLLATGYGLAVLLVMLPLLGPVVTLLPFRPGLVGWRLQAFGALSQALVLPLLGGVVAVGTAVLLGHRRVVRTLSALAMTTGLILLGATCLFLLDFVEYRRAIGPELRAYYRLAGLVYLSVFVLATTFLFGGGIIAWRAAREPRRSRRLTPAGSLVHAPGDEIGT